ncbi:hypothetical protein KC19_10G146600 [Ceratodon purpureus]|uniref:Uncharacterized protein n=1 Tax=Ceratodon purpureus TaxID=3225 RepID=A0A8T0GP70_CERPU|nr:hypothetical protein KC19_10G146600 [Ceratodon purpureus]
MLLLSLALVGSLAQPMRRCCEAPNDGAMRECCRTSPFDPCCNNRPRTNCCNLRGREHEQCCRDRPHQSPSVMCCGNVPPSVPTPPSPAPPRGPVGPYSCFYGNENVPLSVCCVASTPP